MKHYLHRRGISEDEIYPSKSIILNNLEYGDMPGYVKLTEKKKKLLEERKKNIKYIASLKLD